MLSLLYHVVPQITRKYFARNACRRWHCNAPWNQIGTESSAPARTRFVMTWK